MTLPYDGWSVATIVAAALSLFGASRRRFALWARVGLIMLAALLLRLDPAWQISLHTWDESVHAVVAKRLAAHPLVPTLYEHSMINASQYSWTEANVWLHKPPLALWLMALSLWTFGLHALALRLPSLLLGTLSVFVTFLVGRRALDARVGLLAAGFQAVNGLLIALSSGRRVADHVDTALVAMVELGMLLALRAGANGGSQAWAALTGVALGLGILTKSFPAAIIVVVALAIWLPATGARRTGQLMLCCAASAAVVAAPWLVYVHRAFPVVAAAEDAYTLRHITSVVEGHRGPVWSYVADMPQFFGELVYLPIAWFLWSAVRNRDDPGPRMVAVWLTVPYVAFSLMQTKLPGFIAIATPAIFLAESAAWMRLRTRLATTESRRMRVGVRILLALLLLLPARYLLEPSSALERRDRYAAETRYFMELDAKLPSGAVIFNVPRPYELMFYSEHDAYGAMPTPERVAGLRQQNKPIVIYQPVGTDVLPRPEWGAIVLPGR